jgi:hypothetical protein
LNKDLYNIHLQDFQKWGNIWCTILGSIRDSNIQEKGKKYKNIDLKLNKLTQTHKYNKKTNNDAVNSSLELEKIRKYRVSINSFPDYKHLLQENYVEYKRIFL